MIENKEFSAAIINKLTEALKEPEYRRGWVANIAMAYIDEEEKYREENNKRRYHLSFQEKHKIANNAAERFLKILES